ncbi:MAG: type 4a pilus biogenesis protein PilO [Patescibacteria group bacterium]
MKFIFPILFIIVAVGIFIGYTNPLYQEIKAKQVELNTIAEANKKATQLRAVRESLTNERNQISQVDIDRLQKMLPDGVENVRLIIDINNIAAKYGMTIKSTRTNQGSVDKGGAVGPDANRYGTISLSFMVTNSYENFQVFLKDLENSLRIVDVTALSFNSSNENKYDFNVTIQTYWLK